MKEIPYKIYLEESEMPKAWYNLRADGRRMHINSNNTLGAWDTDAYILMTERSSAGERIFAVSASYVRSDGQVRYASYQKKTGYV